MQVTREIVKYLNRVAEPKEMYRRLCNDLKSMEIPYKELENGKTEVLKVAEKGISAFVWVSAYGKIHTMSDKHEATSHEYEDIIEKEKKGLPEGYDIYSKISFKIRDLYGAGEDCGGWDTIEECYSHFKETYRTRRHFISDSGYEYWKDRPLVCIMKLSIRTHKWIKDEAGRAYSEDRKEWSVLTDIEIFK